MQFPKELRQRTRLRVGRRQSASMKCSSRRNCDPHRRRHAPRCPGASMKCSSRRNCDRDHRLRRGQRPQASMKCSSRRNCDRCPSRVLRRPGTRLNEVQFPKELRHVERCLELIGLLASMKCSSRRNCDPGCRTRQPGSPSLNEVQFPKELRLEAERVAVEASQPQ